MMVVLNLLGFSFAHKLYAMAAKKLAPWIAWLLFIALALTWGSSFILMKRGLESFSYTQIGFIRIATAWIFTVGIAFHRFKALLTKDIIPLVGIGLFGNLIPYLLFPVAIKYLDSSLVGILNSMVPLFTLLIGLIWFGIKVKLPSIIGVSLGFVGALWLLLPDLNLDVSRLGYGAYPIIATICYALSINIINTRLTYLGPMEITLLSLSTVGPLCAGFLFRSDFVQVMQSDPAAWLNFTYIALLGIFGSSLAIWVFNILIKRTTPLFAASVTYAIPLVALVWGVFDGEEIGWGQLGGMLAILAGVYLVNRRGSPAARIRKALKKPAKT